MGAKKPSAYPTLAAEIARHGLTKKELAILIGITPQMFSLKMTGKCRFSLEEAVIIQKCFPDIPIEELFAKSA